MNTTLAQFLKIGLTVVTISAFLFFIGYNLVGSNTTTYSAKINGAQSNLPTGAGVSSNN
ncbi:MULTISPECIES: hypothetical protein [Bacillaceae]|jgi:hypothetical protein|uniref:Uncharacterized protein n=1 Tax=Niallia circulans TaxID=1397 RepID=A0A941JIG5_NIACI|nr:MULTISPECIES: hypothetical protein [Bacillaceae]MDU1848227.1 hypothetical protein [Niallia nealsonii]SLL35123.1 Uncharacterised protein [Mycobacteroides abscessus subsp. abscessus]HEO8421299.1 hypothetical protein [Yersinia enterocolitica]MCB5237087.1 hypothetical protein [Niallia circulans]MCM3364336.1 hypothetical protein [Niallia sp. MER TA 168]